MGPEKCIRKRGGLRGYLELTSVYTSLKRHGIPGDVRFIRIPRIFSPSRSCSGRDRMFMRIDSIISKIGIADVQARGLDTSNVTVENVPLIINSLP